MTATVSAVSTRASSYRFHNPILQHGSVFPLTTEDFRSLEYNPLFGPMIGLCRAVYGIMLACFGLIALFFEFPLRYPSTALSILGASKVHVARGLAASFPILGGMALYFWDNS